MADRSVDPAEAPFFHPGDRLWQRPDDQIAEREARSLENPRNKVSGHQAWSGRGRWQALDWLRRNSSLKRQRTCSIRAIGDTVSIRRSDSGAHYSGVMACGSRICPVCGPRLASATREDLRRAIDRWHSPDDNDRPGGTVVFGTFTVRHRLGQSFADLDKIVRKSWKSVLSGRAWKALREDHGILHYVRVFEEKWSPATGWHIHVHYLLFCLEEPEIDRLRKVMTNRWSAAVERAGGSTAAAGQDLRIVRAGADVMADYFAKQSAGLGTADGIASEMTLGQLKKDRGSLTRVKSFTPAELLGLAMGGDEYAALLWREYEQGCIGRRVVGTSHGFREAFDLGVELPDEEIAGSSEAESEEVVSITGRDFRKIVRMGLRLTVLDVATARDAAGLVAWLARYGIRAVAGQVTASLWAYDDDSGG